MTATTSTPPTLLERLLLLDAAAVEASLQTLVDNARTERLSRSHGTLSTQLVKASDSAEDLGRLGLVRLISIEHYAESSHTTIDVCGGGLL